MVAFYFLFPRSLFLCRNRIRHREQPGQSPNILCQEEWLEVGRHHICLLFTSCFQFLYFFAEGVSKQTWSIFEVFESQFFVSFSFCHLNASNFCDNFFLSISSSCFVGGPTISLAETISRKPCEKLQSLKRQALLER